MQSTWNAENRFTGWTDVDLSAVGEEEAMSAGHMLKDAGELRAWAPALQDCRNAAPTPPDSAFATNRPSSLLRNCPALRFCAGLTFDVAYTSVLKRAIRTCWAVLRELNLEWLPVHRNWRLNERHYGALQGLNKSETAAKHGEDQVKIWRRSYDIPPPPLDASDERHPSHDRRYAVHGVPAAELPATESLKETVARFIPAWSDEIAPAIKAGKRVLIAAHGNSIRALIKYLDEVSDKDIVELNIPTGE